jgi:hypothetical protein
MKYNFQHILTESTLRGNSQRVGGDSIDCWREQNLNVYDAEGLADDPQIIFRVFNRLVG